MNNNSKKNLIEARREAKGKTPYTYQAQIPTGGQKHGTTNGRTKDINFGTRPRLSKAAKVGNAKSSR